MNSNHDYLIDKQLIDHWNNLDHKPNLIVFDLDFTLWENYIDNFMNVKTKLIDENGDLVLNDSNGNYLRPFQDVTRILTTLKDHCLKSNQHLAVASRASSRNLALKAIEEFGWTRLFSSIQVYPEVKTIHMKKIITELNIQGYDQILFFDDENRNIVDTSAIGVLACLVTQKKGFNKTQIFDGLSCYNKRKFRI